MSIVKELAGLARSGEDKAILNRAIAQLIYQQQQIKHLKRELKAALLTIKE